MKGDGALDDRGAGLHLEATLLSRPLHDLNGHSEQLGGPFEQIAAIALVGPGIADRSGREQFS